jgi:hypothetical protein
MRRFALFAFFLPVALAVACSSSESPNSGPQLGDAGGQCTSIPPSTQCTCCGTTRSVVCNEGKWECPACTLACVVDAGDSGPKTCTGTPPTCNPCCGAEHPAVCNDGAWECQVCTGACVVDAGHDSSTSDAGAFACGNKTCDGTKEYCYAIGGGPKPLDGGTSVTYTCEPLPSSCHGTASCACVKADDGGNGCPCTTDSAGNVTFACLFP